MNSAAGNHRVDLAIDEKAFESVASAQVDEVYTRAKRSLESDLLRLREEDPEAFAREVPLLQRVECHHNDDATRSRVEFDPSTGTVSVVKDLKKRTPLAEGDVRTALRATFYDELDRRFRTLRPDQISIGDRRPYFVYLRGARFGGSSVPEWVGTERMVRLAAVVGSSDPQLASGIRTWLFARAKDIIEVRKAPPSVAADLAYVRPAWIEWARGALPAATPREKLDFAHALFARHDSSYGYEASAEDPLPGFDGVAFGLAIADEWRAAGHPTATPPGDDRAQLFDFVLAPPYLDPRGKLTRRNNDRSPWIAYAVADSARRERLFDALTKRSDPVLTTAVFYNRPYPRDAAKPNELLASLERSPQTWRHAVLTLITLQRSEGCNALLEEAANHAWAAAPSVRGTALHVLACKQVRRRGTSDKYFGEEFAKLYGAPIDAGVFKNFLEDGPDAMKLVEVVWPALAKGFSRVALIAPKLEGFLASDGVREGQYGEPIDTLRAIEKRLCEDGNLAEVERFRQTLVRLAKADATRARMLATSIDEAAPSRCAAAAKKK
jgi:hypothetical protein